MLTVGILWSFRTCGTMFHVAFLCNACCEMWYFMLLAFCQTLLRHIVALDHVLRLVTGHGKLHSGNVYSLLVDSWLDDGRVAGHGACDSSGGSTLRLRNEQRDAGEAIVFAV